MVADRHRQHHRAGDHHDRQRAERQPIALRGQRWQPAFNSSGRRGCSVATKTCTVPRTLSKFHPATRPSRRGTRTVRLCRFLRQRHTADDHRNHQWRAQTDERRVLVRRQFGHETTLLFENGGSETAYIGPFVINGRPSWGPNTRHVTYTVSGIAPNLRIVRLSPNTYVQTEAQADMLKALYGDHPALPAHDVQHRRV